MKEELELYGAMTGNCIRAAIALEEANLSYRVHRVNLGNDEQRAASLLQLNPAGKVPVLVNHSAANPFVLTQSNAIIFYAATLAPSALLPGQTMLGTVSIYERFFFFVTDVIAVSHAAFALRSMPSAEGKNVLDAQFLSALMSAEHFLGDKQFIAGEAFSIADISAFTIAASVKNQLPWNRLPKLKRWYEAIASRPAVQRGMRAFQGL